VAGSTSTPVQTSGQQAAQEVREQLSPRQQEC